MLESLRVYRIGTKMNLFDPASYAEVRRPLREAQTLPPACYFSPAFYQREISEIFLKKWNLVGRVDYLPQPGDFMARELVGVQFIVIRGDDGVLRAFSNTCRHRGAQLLEGEGNCQRIVCPYHSWTYSNEGRLSHANGMEEAENFDKTRHGLIEIKLETWAGFIFVNFDEGASDLAAYIGDLDRYTHSYHLEDMVTVKRQECVIRTNWKTYVENSMEGFHHATVHKDSVYKATTKGTSVVGDPGHYVLSQSDAGGATRAVLQGDTGFPPISTLEGAAALGAHYLLIYPCTVLGCDVDSMWFKQMVPEGPDRVRNIVAICFPKETVARDDFDEVAPRYYKRFDKVIAEDNVITELQYNGLSSPLARPGRFSHREPLVHVIDNWVLDHVL